MKFQDLINKYATGFDIFNVLSCKKIKKFNI